MVFVPFLESHYHTVEDLQPIETKYTGSDNANHRGDPIATRYRNAKKDVATVKAEIDAQDKRNKKVLADLSRTFQRQLSGEDGARTHKRPRR